MFTLVQPQPRAAQHTRLRFALGNLGTACVGSLFKLFTSRVRTGVALVDMHLARVPSLVFYVLYPSFRPKRWPSMHAAAAEPPPAPFSPLPPPPSFPPFMVWGSGRFRGFWVLDVQPVPLLCLFCCGTGCGCAVAVAVAAL